jgi:prophage maintenance system killer protein
VIWRDFQNAGKVIQSRKNKSFRELFSSYLSGSISDLYPSFEEKRLIYCIFVVKNHSFSDGNKRIAAGLFVYFLYE